MNSKDVSFIHVCKHQKANNAVKLRKTKQFIYWRGISNIGKNSSRIMNNYVPAQAKLCKTMSVSDYKYKYIKNTILTVI